MMKRKWPILVLVASAAVAVVAGACSETGPDADPRTNGCIAAACFDGAVIETDTGVVGPGDGGTDSPTGFPNPLEGTTKSATLVKNGFQFLEGPVWIGGRLLFSDTNANPTAMFELAANGTTSIFRQPANGANGNAVDPQGRLVTCESRARQVVRSDATMGAAKTTLASQYPAGSGPPLNSPNDVIVRADGNIYFTDPDYGADQDAAGRQNKQAVFRINPAGTLSRVKEYDTLPNGIGLSPDGNKLYVVDNDAAVNAVNVWSLAADGTPSGETKFADVTGGDGMAVDDAGNVYVAATAGIVVFDKNGMGLGTITVPEVPANCTFGGADRKTLFITARTSLYKIALNVPGLP